MRCYLIGKIGKIQQWISEHTENTYELLAQGLIKTFMSKLTWVGTSIDIEPNSDLLLSIKHVENVLSFFLRCENILLNIGLKNCSAFHAWYHEKIDPKSESTRVKWLLDGN